MIRENSNAGAKKEEMNMKAKIKTLFEWQL